MKFWLSVIFTLCYLPSSVCGQESFNKMLRLARQGKAWAQNEVGIAYSIGEGVKPNHNKAAYWLKLSAAQGNALGSCSYANILGYGWGVPQNKTLMMKWAFIGQLIDGLSCDTGAVLHIFKPRKCEIDNGWALAITWMREHPEFDDEFGERPWFKDKTDYQLVRCKPVSARPKKQMTRQKHRVKRVTK